MRSAGDWRRAIRSVCDGAADSSWLSARSQAFLEHAETVLERTTFRVCWADSLASLRTPSAPGGRLGHPSPSRLTLFRAGSSFSQQPHPFPSSLIPFPAASSPIQTVATTQARAENHVHRSTLSPPVQSRLFVARAPQQLHSATSVTALDRAQLSLPRRCRQAATRTSTMRRRG